MRLATFPRTAMNRAVELRDLQRDLNNFQLRLAIAGGGVLFVFFVLFVRFFYVQVIQHDYYHTLAEQNRIFIVPVVPNRGLIVDRNGVVLAHNFAAYTLEIMPTQVDNFEDMINRLSILVDITPKDRRRFQKLLEEGHDFASVPIRTRLNDEEVARFAVNAYRFPGVELNARLFRHYPNGEIASHVVGYIGRISDPDVADLKNKGMAANYSASDYIGKVGLEQRYEKDLRGVTGYEHVETDANGQSVRTLRSILPVSGNDLRLALDARLQQVAEQVFGDSPRLAGGDRACHRRGAGAGLQARLRPQSVRRGHRSAELGCAEQFARPSAQQSRVAGRVSAGLDLQAFHGAGGSRIGKAQTRIHHQRSGLFHARRQWPRLPRLEGRWSRHREPAQGGRRVLRYLFLRPGARARHRRHPRIH